MEPSEQNAVTDFESVPESAARQNVALPQPAAITDAERSGQPSVGTGTHIFDVKGVSIYYGSFRAVTNVSLNIYEHQITAFIGPSGCGKTTVLRTLNRMNDLVPGARVEGEVDYRGENL